MESLLEDIRMLGNKIEKKNKKIEIFRFSRNSIEIFDFQRNFKDNSMFYRAPAHKKYYFTDGAEHSPPISS